MDFVEVPNEVVGVVSPRVCPPGRKIRFLERIRHYIIPHFNRVFLKGVSTRCAFVRGGIENPAVVTMPVAESGVTVTPERRSPRVWRLRKYIQNSYTMISSTVSTDRVNIQPPRDIAMPF